MSGGREWTGWNGDAGAQGVEVLSAEAREFGLVAKFGDQPLVLGDGVGGLALFAVAFGESEEGGGGELALFVVLGDDGTVSGNGGVEVVMDFLGEEPLLEGVAQGIGGAGGRDRQQEDEQQGTLQHGQKRI